MTTSRRLTRLLERSRVIPCTLESKFVIMSDCHRGDGTWSDNFLKNQNLFFAALTYYYESGYTYVELGDGDELWENRDLRQIITVHSDAFWIMSQFHADGRLRLLYGNHDKIKKSPDYINQSCSYYYCENHPHECAAQSLSEGKETNREMNALFPGITVEEGLVLADSRSGRRLLLAHGHQGDFLNDTLWPMARFLVRYFWKPLELVGVLDPTSAAKNYRKKSAVEKRLIRWTAQDQHMLLCGHTHRPHFPAKGEPAYFNDGSCVHPRCITAIEITGNLICLVKWTTQTREDRTLFVGREILEGPAALWEMGI